MRSFKGIICDDISEFESFMPSHAIGSLWARQASWIELRFKSPLGPWSEAQTRPPTEAAFYRLKRAKYLVCNIYDATLKIIAVAKVKANIVIHICSSIAWQAGARTVSQPPAPGLSSSRWTGRSR